MRYDDGTSATPGRKFQDIAIVGGGCAGTLMAAQLLLQTREQVRVTLIERNSFLGPGLAYASSLNEHRLNVPAVRMSAFPGRPEHFLNWVRQNAQQLNYMESVEADSFLPRWLYGRYLSSILELARSKAGDRVTFKSVVGEAIDIRESESGPLVVLSNGTEIPCQAVILALGVLPGEYPIRRPLPFYRTRRYVHVPLLQEIMEGVDPTDDLLVVGAGLTAVDIIVQCHQFGHRGRIHALSRRGLRPQAHIADVKPLDVFSRTEALPKTIREVADRLIKEVRRGARLGIDWRAFVDGLRPITQRLWEGFPLDEKARFMRHLRPFWEVHRHRVAPETDRILSKMVAEGRLRYHAGRLTSLQDAPDNAAALFKVKGSDEFVALRVAKVINCSGPRTDYSKYQHPLLINLLSAGLIGHDPLALGLDALPSGEVCRYGGRPSEWLFTLGASLKGVLWECTAVPEIREMAEALAARLLGLAVRDRSSVSVVGAF